MLKEWSGAGREPYRDPAGRLSSAGPLDHGPFDHRWLRHHQVPSTGFIVDALFHTIRKFAPSLSLAIQQRLPTHFLAPEIQSVKRHARLLEIVKRVLWFRAESHALARFTVSQLGIP